MLLEQNLRRQLNDDEIAEFYNGKPELVSGGLEFKNESANFWPFDTKFEISLNDIKYGSLIITINKT